MTRTIVRSEKSTIVRLLRAPWPVRSAFATLDLLAPPVSARWAERLWMTLPRPNRRDHPPVPGGTPFTVTVPGSTQWSGAGPATPVSVAGQVWGDGPVVYLVHGWAGHQRQFDAFIEPLVARGLRVVTFDAPSHGASGPGAFGPRSTSFPEIAAAIGAVVTRFGPPHAFVTHSAGAVATTVAMCDGLRPRRLALLAPMVGVLPHLRLFARAMGFGPRTLSRLTPRLERRVGASVAQFDVPELGRAVGAPPTLVVHDRGDRSTPFTDGAAIAAAWPGARLHLTEGLGHSRLLRDPAVVAQVVDFVAP